jgi:hypothetical protein
METADIRGVNFCSSKATAAAGTTTTFSTTGATLYCIRGKAFSTAAGANAATPTTDAVTGVAFTPITANKGGAFVLCYDGASTAAGAIKVVQGSIEDLDGTAAGASAAFLNGLPEFPMVPDTLTPFAYLIVKVGASGATWTFGTSNLAGPPANTAITFTDVMILPDRPQA